MKLKIAANCIRGNKRRSNEDMVLVGESFLRDGSIDFSLDNPDLCFALVSDGMGGHDHGDGERVPSQADSRGNSAWY